MIKLTICAKRLPHLTREEFDQYWRDHHGSLVRSFADVLRIKRYVQVPTLPNPTLQETIRATRNALAASFDGYAELWWESLEELAAVRATEGGASALRALLEDEQKFVDLAQSQLWYGTEREIVPGSQETR